MRDGMLSGSWEDHSVSESAAIIKAMRRVVPPGRSELSDTEASALRDLTAALVTARLEAEPEYQRFLAIAGRRLCLPDAELSDRIGGATILVTGGTGCIGSTLMTQLATLHPARLVSVSRGITDTWTRPAGAEYRHADVTDRQAVTELLADVRPDIVFHVAAQRSPAVAEAEVQRTVAVNVLGARNVLYAAALAGTRQVVLASTGKALRPYSPEVYTASKRAAEWVAATAAASTDVTCSAARFTHVIDNSIVHQRLRRWAASDTGNEAIRLHSPDIAFYAQSALESAQLLLIAMLGAVPGEFRLHAIKDLGWPINLLDVAIGVLTSMRSRTPVYISGYDPGYEEFPFPGLYDPATAGDVSPLLNAFETAAATSASCPMTDAFRLEFTPDPAVPKLLDALAEAVSRTRDNDTVRRALDELSWTLLDATLAAADPGALARSARLTNRFEYSMSPAHRRITRAVRDHAGRP
jgi:NAD(P)-dependent dehydrogenase (short-subunit alcohol dehydrogenase family)